MSTPRERPIPFTSPMVQAVLAGTKTQTRRVVKPQPEPRPGGMWHVESRPASGYSTEGTMRDMLRIYCPYGAPGDRLWVRETCAIGWTDDSPLAVDYFADGARRHFDLDTPDKDRAGTAYINDSRRPPFLMPRWASRITLEVTGVRVERLQEISEADAQAEGVERPAWDNASCRVEFARLWDDINDSRGYEWKVNPWVWVVEFRRVQP